MNTALIKNPNLPNKQLRHFFIGSKYCIEAEELQNLGCTPITIKGGKSLDSEISFHADVNVFNLGSGNVLVNREIGELDVHLPFLKLIPIKDNISSPYPMDVKLNALFLGDKIICNTKYIAKEILDFADCYKYKIIHTNQGYTKCSVCVIKNNAVITEDDGLANLLKNYQIDVLKVSKDEVYLSDKHMGFLGGASAKVSDDTIYFSGNLEKHRNFNEILSFLDEFNVKPEFNSNRPLRDFGGIIQLTELL